MSSVSALDTTNQKSNELLEHIQDYFGWDSREHAYQAFRSVMHTLRDRLTVNESASLAAQLTLFLKGVFYDGWNPAAVPKKMHKDEFLSSIEEKITFQHTHTTEELVRGVIGVVKAHIDQKEFDKIASWLPEDVATVIS